MDRKPIEQMLAERIGLDPATVGEALFTRVLHARMTALELQREEDYARLLHQSTEEQEALIEEVVVPESWFFRDEIPFTTFRTHVSELWRDRPGRFPLRALSIPCASGEEPYSIAIIARELGLLPSNVIIDAVDVSAQALERAARGIYRVNAFRGDNLAFRDRYFRVHPQGYELSPEIRTCVRFMHGNLLDPSLRADEPPYDVIFCRNLLIYLDSSARRRALDTLDRLLALEGMLFLGHADSLGESESRFEVIGDRGGFACRRASPKATCAVAKHPATPRVPRWTQRAVPPKPLSRPDLPPAVAAKPPHVLTRASSAALLEEAMTFADQGRNQQAAALCERVLRETGPCPLAFFLLGMIRQAEGDLRQAEVCLQKTVYLDPTHDEALLALALIADRRGDPVAASTYRRRAARAHGRKGTA
jgi:chemotaxis protein methyltransferase WspC